MADYKELIRKAIQALPENNGAARRAVYEKARAALVGQLRGLNPPLAARDITQHRLQLEDCIRQVEQEASEQVIAGLKQNEDFSTGSAGALPPPRPGASARSSANGARPALTNGASRPAPMSAPPPASRSTASPPPRPSTISATPRASSSASARSASPSRSGSAAPVAVPRIAAAAPRTATATIAPVARATTGPARSIPRGAIPFPRAVPQPEPEPEIEAEYEPDTIEDIIAAAEGDVAEPIDFDQEPEADDDEPRPPMFRIEQRSTRKPAAANGKAAPDSRPLPAIVARAEAAKARPAARAPEAPPRRANGNANGSDTYRNGTPQPARQQLTSRQNAEPIRLPRPANKAMSSVREVDLENPAEGDPQIAIERAIATLEREARNDGEDASDEAIEDFNDRAPPQNRRKNGLDTGFREPLTSDAGFARAPVEKERGGGSAVTIFLLVFLVLLIAAGGGGFWAWREGFIDFDAMFGKAPTTEQASNRTATPPVLSADNGAPATQTNTESAPSTAAQSTESLSAAPAQSPPAATAPPEPSAQTGTSPKSEERLTQSTDNAAPAPSANGTPATATPGGGSQSLLLEASQDGTTGAVPFSGTVDWSEGKDEMGQPTLVGKANIPARNLGVSVLIRKNNDPALPASHLMEINFSVTDSFIGGAISGLPGVLLKNEELVQGTPLVGASARVVGNSFLFALSSSAADEQTNKDLLTSRKWMDLAIIYATGKKAIITLEKDDKTQQLFNDVFAQWAKASPPPAAPAAAPAKP